MVYHSLPQLLHEVIAQYGCSPLLPPPTIDWSQEETFQFFGSYQPYHNHILISRVLDHPAVTPLQLKSVIYHELIHQVYSEHNKAFKKRMNAFPKHRLYYNQLCAFYDRVELPVTTSTHRLTIPPNMPIVYLVLDGLTTQESMQEVQYLYRNQVLIDLGRKRIFQAALTQRQVFVFWLMESETTYQSIGWSIVALLPTPICLQEEEIGGIDFTYQAITTYQDHHLYYPYYGYVSIEKQFFSKDFYDYGHALAQDEASFLLERLQTCAKQYHYGFTQIGIPTDKLHATIPLHPLPWQRICEMADEALMYQSLWLANTAIKQEVNATTLLTLANAYYTTCFFDECLKVVLALYEQDPQNQEALTLAINTALLCNHLALARRLLDDLAQMPAMSKAHKRFLDINEAHYQKRLARTTPLVPL